jgi:hypothetical protein
MRTWLTLGVSVAFAVGVACGSYAAQPKAEICWQCEATLKEVKAAEKAEKRAAMVVLLSEAEIKADRVVTKVDPKYGRAWLVLAKVSWYFGEGPQLRERVAKVEKYGTKAEVDAAKWLLANPHANPVARVGSAPREMTDEGGDVAAAPPADTLVAVHINGKETELEPRARQREGVTFVPVRPIAETVGAFVWWDEPSQTVTITLGDRTTEIAKDRGIVVEDQLLLPLSPVAEALGAKVKWDEAAKTVRLTTKPPAEG